MRAVVQRANSGQVSVDGQLIAAVGPGLVVLLAVQKGDGPEEAEYMVEKLINLRVFEDQAGKMNRSLLETGGEVLLVSQFTLYGDCRKGRRPGFDRAELPEAAQTCFDYAASYMSERGIMVRTGIFGADMLVTIENDGPCTILLDSDKIF